MLVQVTTVREMAASEAPGEGAASPLWLCLKFRHRFHRRSKGSSEDSVVHTIARCRLVLGGSPALAREASHFLWAPL